MRTRFLPILFSLLMIATPLAPGAALAGGANSTAASSSATTVIGPSGLPVPRFVALKKDKVRARFGPSFDYPVAFTYHRKGLPLKVIAETRDDVWRRVEDRDGRRMWIHRSMLMGNDSAVVAREDAVLRAKPSEGAPGRARPRPAGARPRDRDRRMRGGLVPPARRRLPRLAARGRAVGRLAGLTARTR
nr:SH3 domain-containing protein [Parvularcula oceani]